MTIRKLWIDDVRNPPDNTFDVARTYWDALEYLLENQYDEVDIDHDLGCFKDGREYTGYDILMWLADLKSQGHYVPPTYYVLTANPVGRVRMQQVIDQYLTFKKEQQDGQ